MCDDVVAKLRTFDLRCAFHLASEVVGHSLAANRTVQAFQNRVRCFRPAKIAEHHFAAQHDRAGIHDIFVCVFWRGAVRGLKNRVAGDVIDVAAGRDADAADLRRQRVAQVIAVQIQRGDDIEVRRAREHLLERDVGDGVLDDDARTGSALGNFAPGSAIHLRRAEFRLRQLITPVAECALGVFHDVAFVDNRHALAFVRDGVLDGRTHQTLGAGLGHGLDADADQFRRFGAKADLFEILGEVRLEEFNRFERLFLSRLKIYARVNILRIFAEDYHVDLLRMLHGRRNTGEPLHGAQADVEIEHLAERDVERADAAADRRGERAFDADEMFLERGDGVVRQPVVELVFGRFSGKHFKPRNFPFAAVGLLYYRVEHAYARGPNVRAGAVAANERENGVVRHVELAVLDRNFPTRGRSHVFIGHDAILDYVFKPSCLQS